MPKRKRSDESKAGAPLWMTTYADMVTLLLAFFVLLFAFSSIDVQQFQRIMSAFQGGSSVLDGGRTITSADRFQEATAEIDFQQLYELERQLTVYLEEQSLDGIVFLEMEERGLIIRFADQVFFDLGRADLKPEAIAILDPMARLLRDLNNPMRVEGHSDNLPISTQQFPSNWELSTHRASRVVRYLVEEQNFDPRQLSAAGYGEYRPILPNETAADRAMNRRVDIVIMHQGYWLQEPN